MEGGREESNEANEANEARGPLKEGEKLMKERRKSIKGGTK